MSSGTKRLGRDLLAKRGNGDGPPETYTTVAGCKTHSVSINNNPIDVTDKQSGQWAEIMSGGIKKMSISASGVFASDTALRACKADIFSVAGADRRNWTIVMGNGDTYVGPFFMTSMEDAGEFGGEQTFSMKWESAGPIVFTPGP
jgi:TP901-1 family phage major tail protein